MFSGDRGNNKHAMLDVVQPHTDPNSGRARGDALHVKSEHILNATCGSPPGRNSSLFLY